MRAVAFIAVFLLAACGKPPATATDSPAIAAADVAAGDPAEGLRVATRVGCNGCHAADGGGKVFDEDEDQGLVVTANLTIKRELYDDAAFAALLREGRTHDGHVPWGMPIKMLQHLSDREVRDITAWMRSLPAVRPVGMPQTKWSPSLAKAIADGTHPWLPDMKPDAGNKPPAMPPVEPLALGRHLAMTSCGECHGWNLDGFEGDDAPSLVVAKAYTPEAFVRLMRTGVTADGRESKTGLMSRMARDRFAPSLTDAEIAALKQYLDSR
ncbi:MAG: c-type cytochrome [Thermomonas sp.]